MVMLIFAVTKFTEGAWVVLILIPVLVAVFLFIHRHYYMMASRLSLENYGEPPPYTGRHRVIVPISNVHQGTLAALRYPRILSDDVTVVHVSTEPGGNRESSEEMGNVGQRHAPGHCRFPVSSLLEPLLGYIEEIIASRQQNETITIVVPQFVPSKRYTICFTCKLRICFGKNCFPDRAW